MVLSDQCLITCDHAESQLLALAPQAACLEQKQQQQAKHRAVAATTAAANNSELEADEGSECPSSPCLVPVSSDMLPVFEYVDNNEPLTTSEASDSYPIAFYDQGPAASSSHIKL